MVRPAAVVAPMTDATREAHASVTEDWTAAADFQPVPDPAPALAPDDSYESDFAPVIRSKIQPPALRSTTLTRQRLIDRLHESTASRVTLVVAEAGYGKTTLLADFAARSGQRTLWYRLDPTDGDAITWTNYLIAACRELEPTFGDATIRLLSHVRAGSPPRSAFIDSLIGELSSWVAAPTTLVLDDFHQVDRFSEVCEVVTRLIDDAPEWLHFVISTRRRAALELARLAAAGALSELGIEELRFSESETSRLFAESYGKPLDREVVRSLEQRTRGWAASLSLFYGSIRDRSTQDASALAQQLSGASTPIYDFLAEEVLTHVPEHIESVLMRAAVLDLVSAKQVVALFGDELNPPSDHEAARWLEEADGLGLLSRVSRSSEVLELHPLLRDFLAVRLRDRLGSTAIRSLHSRVAEATLDTDPLVACKHFVEAGDHQKAMDVLESSILRTLGSGQWGQASNLVERLRETQAGPGVAAIWARQLMTDGDLAGAERTLESVIPAVATASARSAVRQTQLALGWRTGNRELIRESVAGLLADPETPAVVRDIAQVFVDADPDSPEPRSLRVLAGRLEQMARTQARSGFDFFSAVSLHNSSVAYLAAADFQAALDAGQQALSAFSLLQFQAAEALSTHSVIAVALMEAGRWVEAQQHVRASMADGREFADVPASIAVAFLSAGMRDEALTLISRARTLERQGRSDVAGFEVTEIADAFSRLSTSPAGAIEILGRPPAQSSMDLGHALERTAMLAHTYMALGEPRAAAYLAEQALDEARTRGARRAEVRLALLAALAAEDEERVSAAIRDAAASGQLALSELADVLCDRLDLAERRMDELGHAISTHPLRWLPALRRALGRGAPTGHPAALLIDRFGESRDVSVLRAYARTYRSRGASPALGVALARRTSPKLRIHDLGRVILEVGERSITVSGMRRKPAALLMYLVSRSSFTAHREQVIDDLWPDADPSSALNSLNQSLYFLRREIDPWYEDGVSPDYVGFAGDLLWLDAELVSSDSGDFVAATVKSKRYPGDGAPLVDLVRSYTGHFAPEFEYEEWALAFRSKLKSAFLETATSSIGSLVGRGDLDQARSIAMVALEIDETAVDVERALVWLHWRLGAKSAAKAQYEHLARVDQLDGLEPVPFRELVDGDPPLGHE